MNRSYLNAFRTSSLMLALAAIGCGEPSDRPSEVHTLRVLAVRSETPFAKPGTTATLSMLAYDGSPRAQRADGSARPTSTLWIGGCTNPPGDSYEGCLPHLHSISDQFGDGPITVGTQPATLPSGVIGWGQTFDAQIPDNVISSRPAAAGVVYPYGVEMVFFAYCGGTLGRLTTDARSFPLACFDSETGEELGRDDFEFGYYPVFSFETVENQNPVIASAQFEGNVVGGDPPCSEVAPCAAGYHCGSQNLCIPTVARCTRSDKDDCDDHPFAVTVPHDSVEPEVVAHVSAAEAPPETLWVSYYATAGSFEHDSRIINDAHSGWSDDTSGRWRANVSASQEVRIWAVVRDNRNGVAWTEQSVWVE